MRKKLFAVMLAIMSLFFVFSLVGCTDNENAPRELTAIEQRIVDEWGWEWQQDTEPDVTFRSDGTAKYIGGECTFKEIGHNNGYTSPTGYVFGVVYEIELTSKTNSKNKYSYFYYPDLDCLSSGLLDDGAPEHSMHRMSYYR